MASSAGGDARPPPELSTISALPRKRECSMMSSRSMIWTLTQPAVQPLPDDERASFPAKPRGPIQEEPKYYFRVAPAAIDRGWMFDRGQDSPIGSYAARVRAKAPDAQDTFLAALASIDPHPARRRRAA